MFKKFKDKITEEVKSSPQRIQQFAQAAQAVVTSASSSISDITNNDLFSIGDNDPNNRSPVSTAKHKNSFHEISLGQQQMLHTSSENVDTFNQEETSRERRLSNSSLASDISFRLPTYESPSMYHLQSDMDVSASETDEKGFSSGTVNLDRVTKEQLYFAYRRTQDRCTKFKTQYADLARHYKLLERENAKARNVLVETQDKALRRISELKEQCSLEQSAKAHLEKALRVEIEEKNLKIDTLNMKLKFLQENKDDNIIKDSANQNENDNNAQLIDLSSDEKQEITKEPLNSEITALNNKVTKMEQLLNKYKESLKVSKEKNAQLTAEMQILSTDLESKNKENEHLKANNSKLIETQQKVDELNGLIEKIQNDYNSLEFSKNKEITVLKQDLEQGQEEILKLNNRIEGLSKREEEYAISLAENKLRIHKELESKEAEIKSLKDSLTVGQNEIQSLNNVISNYKNNISLLEEEQSKLSQSVNELNKAQYRIKELELQLEDLGNKCQSVENCKVKLDEEYKCLELQLKQETAEKLAMKDRNSYLENRNTQLSEDCLKKNTQINKLETDIKLLKDSQESQTDSPSENMSLVTELNTWKTKYIKLQSEIQEERDELVKLQTEIEKLLFNYESVQTENKKLHAEIIELNRNSKVVKSDNEKLNLLCKTLFERVNTLQQNVQAIKQEIKFILEEVSSEMRDFIRDRLHIIVNNVLKQAEERENNIESKVDTLKNDLKNVTDLYQSNQTTLNEQIRQNEEIQSLRQQETRDLEALKETLNKNVETHDILLREMTNLKDENQRLSVILQQEIEMKKDALENINRFEREKTELIQKLNDFRDNNIKIKKENEEFMSQLKHMEDIKTTAEKNKQYLEDIIEEHKKDKINLEIGNAHLLQKNKDIEEKNNDLNSRNQNLEKKFNEIVDQINHLKTENEKLHDQIKNLKDINSEMESTNHKQNELDILNEKITTLQDQKIEIEADNKKLKNEIFELKTSNSALVTENQELQNKLKDILEQNSVLESENNFNLKELHVIKDSNIYLQEKVNIIKMQNEDDATALEEIKNKNSDLQKKVEDYDLNLLHCNELEKELEELKAENMLLKNHCTDISNKVKELETKTLSADDSCIEIREVKDTFSAILPNFENICEADINISDNISMQNMDHKNVLNKLTSQDLIAKGTQTNGGNQHQSFIETTSDEYASLKEENRRLRSDVEGLQTYLTKISKENSHLNDKLREVITSNDNFTEQCESSQYDMQTLKNEIRSGKDKIDNLIRENTLLVEENLELKDQIRFQSFNKPVHPDEVVYKDKDDNNIHERYNNILVSKKNLEKKINELEYINSSVTTNMQQMQDNNEKLRLANDKLGRRLDEALVSLRHLHSLQENTELEYLRNILYEYLTGSGTHSLTLAKVLSAVVKFNEAQTELVLQKEKERQGVLGQLGLK
ncbi:golgin subfamily A member 4-like [Battus philenor]|uniref:golgin subfamily A member 4-like n=1 Tax=Battus philenor TaxID=42288 RepID=UPI0035CE86CB